MPKNFTHNTGSKNTTLATPSPLHYPLPYTDNQTYKIMAIPLKRSIPQITIGTAALASFYYHHYVM